jgi:hypothetical protein
MQVPKALLGVWEHNPRAITVLREVAFPRYGLLSVHRRERRADGFRDGARAVMFLLL